MKLDYALVAMEGNALHWMQWLLNEIPNISWHKFTVELLRRYRDDPRANPCESLALTRQTGTVDEYVDSFITRLADVPTLTKPDALGIFLQGFREDICV